MAREYDHLFKLLIIGDSGKLHMVYINKRFIVKKFVFSCICILREVVYQLLKTE